MSVRTPERGAGAGSTHRKWQKEKNILRGEMPLQPKKKLKAGPWRGWKARAHTPLQPILAAGEGGEQ